MARNRCNLIVFKTRKPEPNSNTAPTFSQPCIYLYQNPSPCQSPTVSGGMARRNQRFWDCCVIDELYRPGRLPVESDSGVESRHLLSEIFNNLILAGFRVEGVWEDPRHLIHTPDEFRPGTWEHIDTYVQCELAILGRKQEQARR